jgi:hypothetical protein
MLEPARRKTKIIPVSLKYLFFVSPSLSDSHGPNVIKLVTAVIYEFS